MGSISHWPSARGVSLLSSACQVGTTAPVPPCKFSSVRSSYRISGVARAVKRPQSHTSVCLLPSLAALPAKCGANYGVLNSGISAENRLIRQNIFGAALLNVH